MVVFLVLLSAGSVEAVGRESDVQRARSAAPNREPLRPFSEIEGLFLRGALLAAAVPAIWLVMVLIRGALRDRREATQRQDPPQRSKADTASGPEP
jgi:hypothetical protein